MTAEQEIKRLLGIDALSNEMRAIRKLVENMPMPADPVIPKRFLCQKKTKRNARARSTLCSQARKVRPKSRSR